jgi:hypothetical protein
VQRNAANRFTSRILLSAASVAASAAVCAGNIVGIDAPTSRSPQITLYFSQTLWSPGTSFRVYGLRIEEVRARANGPGRAPADAGSMRRSELFDLQIVPHSDIRIEFARRLVWDSTHGAFGLRSSPSGFAIGLSIHRIRSPDPVGPQPWDLRKPGLSLMAGRLVPEPKAQGLIVTVAAAFVTLRDTPSFGSPGTATGGLATSLLQGRVCGLGTCLGSVDGFHSSSFDH